jgi:hypothetical protein
MAFKAITIYTPTTQEPHIFAEDDAQIHRAYFGGSGITDADNHLEATIIDNNTVRLDSGAYSNQGYILCVPNSETADMTIGSGTAGVYRRDLIIARFVRGGGVTADTHIFTVIAGTQASSESAAQRPTLTQENIAGNGSTREEALYEVLISGTEITSVTRIANYVGGFYA